VIGQQTVQAEQQRNANARLQIDQPIRSRENRGASSVANWSATVSYISQLQPLRLPPVEDCLDDVRGQARERQEPGEWGDPQAPLSAAQAQPGAALHCLLSHA
jgi:hypothetical protein